MLAAVSTRVRSPTKVTLVVEPLVLRGWEGSVAPHRLEDVLHFVASEKVRVLPVEDVKPEEGLWLHQRPLPQLGSASHELQPHRVSRRSADRGGLRSTTRRIERRVAVACGLARSARLAPAHAPPRETGLPHPLAQQHRQLVVGGHRALITMRNFTTFFTWRTMLPERGVPSSTAAAAACQGHRESRQFRSPSLSTANT